MDLNLPEEIESLEAIPAPFAAMYGEGDEGKYRLDPRFTEAAKTVLGLNNALRASRAEAKKLAASKLDLGPLGEYGATPEEVAARVADLKAQLEATGGKNEAKMKETAERLRRELSEQHTKALTEAQRAAELLRAQLVDNLISAELEAAMARHGGRPKAAALLAPVIRNRVKAVQADNGRLSLRVVADNGDEAYGLDGSPLGVAELVSQYRKDETYGYLFESQAPSGGGMAPTSGRTVVHTGNQPMTAAEKIAIGLARAGR